MRDRRRKVVTPQGLLPARTSTLFTTHSLGTAHHSPRERERLESSTPTNQTRSNTTYLNPQVMYTTCRKLTLLPHSWSQGNLFFSLNTRAKLHYLTCAVYVYLWGEFLAMTKKQTRVESLYYWYKYHIVNTKPECTGAKRQPQPQLNCFDLLFFLKSVQNLNFILAKTFISFL